MKAIRPSLRIAAGISTFIGAAYMVRQRRQQQVSRLATEHARQLLTRAAPLLRLPTSPDQEPEVLSDGTGLRCRATGRIYAYHNGVLDLLERDIKLTDTQHVLNTPLSAWAYDRFRFLLMRFAGLPPFTKELSHIRHMLQVQQGDTVLDLACGPGNFTMAWAKLVKPGGLVIGLDISGAMLARAASGVRKSGHTNVLLIRGDAQQLPFSKSSFSKINCSGGFHQIPDLPRALGEIARVATPGSILTASTFAEGQNDRFVSLKRWLKQRFALHFVPLDWLGTELAAVGYAEYQESLPGGWFGYTSARKHR